MNKYLMERAISEARSNEGTKRAKMAAILTNKNTIMSVGYNQYKTHPMQAKFSSNDEAVFMHAEINCLVKFLRTYTLQDIVDCDMYIARVFKDGTPALAKPCAGCKGAIVAFGVRNVFWSE